jgi:hypothetical protein
MSVSTCFSRAQSLKRRRHTWGTVVLALLCSGMGGCGKPLRGVATVIGVRNTTVESPRPPAPSRVADRGSSSVKERAARTVPRADRVESRDEAPRPLGTSGISTDSSTRPVRPAGEPDAAIEAGATSTSGQGQAGSTATSPGPQQGGHQALSTQTDRRRLVQLVTIPLTVVALIAAVVVGRRLW